ncbi:hypothetical protein EDD21DRAFT_357513 [Dissophora ornata]|nr:hypothetical protein EDD21DRAFT_357513 [Dissophora ornata]
MRVPYIFLLSSAALSLIDRAETASSPSSSSPLLTNPEDNNSINNHRQAILVANNKAAINDDDESEKVYPVGKGIVYTKASFFVKANKNKIENTGADGADGTQEPEEGSTDSSSDNQTAMDFLGNLFGIDLSGGLNAIRGTHKGNKDKDTDKGEDKVNSKDRDAVWEETPLYGDEGYVPRAVPEGCAELEYMDQMIWDQQGSREEVTKLEKNDKSVVNNQKEEEEGIKHQQHYHKVNHKQKKFLKQFRGKALQIDGNTGCPLPIVS